MVSERKGYASNQDNGIKLPTRGSGSIVVAVLNTRGSGSIKIVVSNYQTVVVAV